MDPRDAMQNPETQGSEMQAPEAERLQMDQGEARRGFRPLALPALAAAAQTAKPAAKPVARTGRTGVLAIVHEDAPID